MRATLLASLLVVATGCSQADSTPENSAGFGAATEQWTFVPVDGMVCGTGTATGIGVNIKAGATKLVFFLEGGGACYSVPGCTGSKPTTSHFTGFGASDLEEYAGRDGKKGIFDRGDAKNPFADYNYVFVPYCTGDVHIGNKVSGDLHYLGQPNFKAALARTKAELGMPSHAVLTGSSAGGFGTMYNFFLFADAFPSQTTMFIDDSGPMLPIKVFPALKVVLGTWGLAGTVAPGCDKCLAIDDPEGGPHNLIPYYASKYPGRRGSLLSSLRDKTISQNFFIAQDALETALNTLADQTVPLNGNFNVYYLPGETHVWDHGDKITGKLADVKSNGVALDVFMKQERDGDAAWKDVRPAMTQ